MLQNTLGLAILAMATLAGHSQVFVAGNLAAAADSDGGNAFANPLIGGNFGRAQAVGFIMTDFSSDLSSVQLALFGNENPTSPSVRIFTGASEPTTEVGAMSTTDTLTLEATTLTFTPMGTIPLLAGSTYWIVLENAADDGFSTIYWAMESGGGRTPSGQTYVGAAMNSQKNWEGTTTLSPTTAVKPNFAIYATVPEPRDFALVAALGLGAFAACRRRFSPGPPQFVNFQRASLH